MPPAPGMLVKYPGLRLRCGPLTSPRHKTTLMLDILFSPRILLATLLLLGASLLLGLLEAPLLHRLRTARPLDTLAAWVGLPLARLLAVLLFVAVAHPRLYGLDAAPALSELMAVDGRRWHHLLNSGFLVGVTLPFVPPFNRLPGAVVPAQAITACALVFHWLAADRGIEATAWPGLGLLGVMLGWSWLAHRLARAAALAAGRGAQGPAEMREALVFESLLLVLQVPIVVAYGAELGSRLLTAAG